MNEELIEKYPHLMFRKNWDINNKIIFLLAKCEAYVQAISNMPILPEDYAELLQVSLIKGAQATTAIEGNTLSEMEIKDYIRGKKVPQSKKYQEIEVNNILEAFNTLRVEVAEENRISKITPDLLKKFHIMVGKNLGDHFDAIPGRFRNDNRIVGRYRCPDHPDVEKLINNLSNWLVREFHYPENQPFHDIVIQSIITHVYIEWIHPFGDGNGRTGRLTEFYLLLRGGNPDIASHILSNHYNLTRNEYYRQLDNCAKNRNLTAFLEYAIQGYHDGLELTLNTIQKSLMKITWQKYIYDFFSENINEKKNSIVRGRMKKLLISIDLEQIFSSDEIPVLNPIVAREYANVNQRTIQRDVKYLVENNLLKAAGSNKFMANFQLLKGYLPSKRKKG